jgi:thioredoxin 2
MPSAAAVTTVRLVHETAAEENMIRTCNRCGRKNRVAAPNLTSRVRCGACKTELDPITRPIDADASLFDEVVNGARVPVLVDFWAEWCGPCRMAAPEVERVARDTAGRALVLKVNTDEQTELAERYRVRGIPLFMVFHGGRAVKQQAGVASHEEMKHWLEAAASHA